MNPIEQRVYLTDRKLRDRFSQSPALAHFLQNLPEVSFDEDEARKHVHERNELRRSSHLPVVDIEEEVARAKCAYFSRAFWDEFYPLTSEMIEEVYGPLGRGDFSGVNGAWAFYVHRRNIIHVMLSDMNIRLYQLRARTRRSLLDLLRM